MINAEMTATQWRTRHRANEMSARQMASVLPLLCPSG